MPDDNDDLFRDPNDNAYVKQQVRVGPPLEYVAEKFRNALVATHDLLHNLRRQKQDEAISLAIYALRSQLVGYLALKNMLALMNSEGGVWERVETFSHDELKEWLDRIDQAGSVT